MSKITTDAREKLQHEAQQFQQAQQEEAARNQQKAEAGEVAGRHRQDGIKDHQGNDKGPRGQ